MQVSDGWLLVDDVHRVAPALLRRLKLLRDRVKIIAAGVPPFQREELRRVLWGLPEIKVGLLPKEDMTRIAQAVVPLLASKTPIIDAVHAARGLIGQTRPCFAGRSDAGRRKGAGRGNRHIPYFPGGYRIVDGCRRNHARSGPPKILCRPGLFPDIQPAKSMARASRGLSFVLVVGLGFVFTAYFGRLLIWGYWRLAAYPG